MNIGIFTRHTAIEAIHNTFKEYDDLLSNLFTRLKTKAEVYMSANAHSLAFKYTAFNKALQSDELLSGLESLDNESLVQLLVKCRKLATGFSLPIKKHFSTGGLHIAEHWIDNGNGTFTAKENATLWELFGNDWKKLTGYQGDPRELQPGATVYFKKDTDKKVKINADLSKPAETKQRIQNTKNPFDYAASIADMIFSHLPTSSRYTKTLKQTGHIIEVLNRTQSLGKSHAPSDLSLYQQQFSNEGEQEDGMEIFLTWVSTLPGIGGFIASMSNFCIPQHQYQIIIYSCRLGFINGAQKEIERLNTLIKQPEVKLFEINRAGTVYKQFLLRQIILLRNERNLNVAADKQNVAQIRATEQQYGMLYEEKRRQIPESYIRRIDYYQQFKNEEVHIDE